MAFDVHEPQVEVVFENLDRVEKNLENYSIDGNWLTSTDGFSFTIYSDQPERLRNLKLQPIHITIDGAVQLHGRVERTRRSSKNTVTCEGRDYISDMVESHIDPQIRITKGMTLEELVVQACRPFGIEGIVTDEDETYSLAEIRSGKKTGARPNSPLKQLSAEEAKARPGAGVYQFLSTVLERFGATIQPWNQRNKLYIQAPHYDQDPLYELLAIEGDSRSNVKSATVVEDYQRVPTFGIFTSKVSKDGKAHGTESALLSIFEVIEALAGYQKDLFALNLADGRRTPSDSGFAPGALYRLLYSEDKESKTRAQLERASRREISERIRDILVYTCSVQGYRDAVTGAIYANDTIATVRDEIRDVNEELWVIGHKFTGGRGSGSSTDLTLLKKGVIQL